MLHNPFTKWLWDARRSILGWTLAIVFVGAGYAAFWPTVDTPELRDALDSYPQAVLEAINYTDISTAAGYLGATVYGLIVAVLLVVYAVSWGTRTIAGDEDAETLDLILAYPLSRRRLALQRFSSLVVSLAIITAALLLSILGLVGPARLEGISLVQFLAMHLHLLLFATFFGAVSYAVGASTGSKGLAIAVGSAVGVLGYLANSIIPQLKGLEWVRNLSPFHWLVGDNPLKDGVQLGNIILMLGLITVLVAAGTWRFDHRDVAV